MRSRCGSKCALPSEGGVVSGGAEQPRDIGCAIIERDAVRHDAVRQRMLPGQHRRARRHADDVLHVRAPIVEAALRQRVDAPACARADGR